MIRQNLNMSLLTKEEGFEEMPTAFILENRCISQRYTCLFAA